MAPSLEAVCRSEVTLRVISFVALKASSVVQCNLPPPLEPYAPEQAVAIGSPQRQMDPACGMITPPTTPAQLTEARRDSRQVPPAASSAAVPGLLDFIAQVVAMSRARMPTLLATLVYLDRLQRRLPKSARGIRCTCHRLFLAAFILAAKYTNDSSPKNSHWANYAIVFSLTDINLMERQLLLILDFVFLDFDLKIEETDLLLQIRPLQQHREMPAAVAPLGLLPCVAYRRRRSAAGLEERPEMSGNWRSGRRFSVAGNVPSDKSAASAGGAARLLFRLPLPAPIARRWLAAKEATPGKPSSSSSKSGSCPSPLCSVGSPARHQAPCEDDRWRSPGRLIGQLTDFREAAFR